MNPVTVPTRRNSHVKSESERQTLGLAATVLTECVNVISEESYMIVHMAGEARADGIVVLAQDGSQDTALPNGKDLNQVSDQGACGAMQVQWLAEASQRRNRRSGRSL